jgi:hypothetical protein
MNQATTHLARVSSNTTGLGGLGLPVSQSGRWRLRGSVIERYECVSPQDTNPPCGSFKVSKISATSLTAYATSVKRTLTWKRVGAAGR